MAGRPADVTFLVSDSRLIPPILGLRIIVSLLKGAPHLLVHLMRKACDSTLSMALLLSVQPLEPAKLNPIRPVRRGKPVWYTL